MKIDVKRIVLLAFVGGSAWTLNGCGSHSFDDPPNIAGNYSKLSENCTDTFFDMPANLKIEQIGPQIEIEPGIGFDLDGSVDNSGRFSVDDAKDESHCEGDYDEETGKLSIDCNINQIDCSGIYQRI